MTQDTNTTPSRAIDSLFRLLSINLTGKLFSVGVFMLMARSLEPEHLAFVGLVEPISFMAIFVFSLGIGTTLEKKVPRLLIADPLQAKAMMRSGWLIMCAAIALFVTASMLFSEYWAPIIFRKYSYQSETIALFILPIAMYMLGWIISVNLLVMGNTEAYSKIRIYGNLSAYITTLGLYAYYPSDASIFVGLAIGQIPFVVYGIYLQRTWLFQKKLYSPLRLIRESRIYYLEGIFNGFRSVGDSLAVSSILGPIAMAQYFVARTVAGQLNVFFQPLGTVIVHRFGMKLGESRQELEQDFSRVWSVAPAAYTWLSACYAASIPAVLVLFAGETYSGGEITSVVIAYVFLGYGLLGIADRVLLVMGSSFERFRSILIHNALALTLLVLTMSIATPTTVALAWLGATIGAVAYVRYRAIKIGFTWPTDIPVIKSLIVCLPVPAIAFGSMNYEGAFDLTYLFIVSLLAMASLLILILWQSDDEESTVLSLISEPFSIWYRRIRLIRRGSNE